MLLEYTAQGVHQILQLKDVDQSNMTYWEQ